MKRIFHLRRVLSMAWILGVVWILGAAPINAAYGSELSLADAKALAEGELARRLNRRRKV